MYTFLFDRRSMTLFVTGLVAVGLLLFGAGVLVGMRISLPEGPVQLADFEPLSEFDSPRGEESGAAAIPGRLPKAPLEVPAEVPAKLPEKLPEKPALEVPKELPAGLPKAASEPTAAEAARPEPLPAPPPARPATAPAATPPAERPALPADPVPAADLVPAAARGPEEAPAPEAAPTPSTAPAARAVYFVQVGAYRVQENAEKHLAALLAEGFNAYLQPLERSSGTLQAVRFGSFASREGADQAASRYLEREPGREALVWPPR